MKPTLILIHIPKIKYRKSYQMYIVPRTMQRVLDTIYIRYFFRYFIPEIWMSI